MGVVVRFGVTTPARKRLQDFVSALAIGPQGVIDVQPDFVVTLMHAVGFAAKVGHVADPDNSIERDVFIVDLDEW